MKSGVWIRLLGAAIIVIALFYFIQNVAGLANRFDYYLRYGSLELWLTEAFSLVLELLLVWAGFSIISRRPSRRRAVTAILAVASAFQAYSWGTFLFVQVMRGYVSLEQILVQSCLRLVWLAPLGAALAYLIATGEEAEFQPRLAVRPPEAAPASAHRVVAAKISDGPGWHEALLASLRDTGMQETPRRRIWPWVLAFIVLALLGQLIGRLIGPLIDGLPKEWQNFAWLVFALISIAALGLPIAAIRRRMVQGRQRNAETALKKSDTKRPVFYLRSFALDDEVGRPSILELLLNAQPSNPEQTMTRIAGRCGPVLAIGRPGEKLPALGAARFYVAQDLWQEKVADVATVAQLVIWASGVTQGLQWEITHLVRSLSPDKLILWAHPHLLDLDRDEREAQWAGFVDGLGNLFPKPLPKPLGRTRFFAFAKDFTPIPYGARRLTSAGALKASLLALLRAKDIPPYDKARTARRQRLIRIGLASVGAVCAVLVIAAGIGFWNYVKPAPPEALSWNLLGSDLIDDEIFVSPPSSDEVLGRLRATVGQLDGHWFGDNWEHVAPGTLPPLKHVAQDYLAVFEAAHQDAAIESTFYIARTMLGLDARSAADAAALSQKLAPVREALGIAERDWAAVKGETTGYFYADKIRNLIAARERLFSAESAFLDLLATHPAAWVSDKGADGSSVLRFNDDGVLAQARTLAGARDAAFSAVQTALKQE
ncbi:MAG TPA: hypothetical protein VKV77_05275 [Methylovirgula sp.]|nr:hypothetical protein [Methylovirgula sp.]